MKKILGLLFISLFFITHAQAITIAAALKACAGKISRNSSKVDLSGRGIDSWYGVQFIKKQFPNMQELNLSHNQLPSVPLLARSLVKDSVKGIGEDIEEGIIEEDIEVETAGAIVELNLEYNNIEWVERKLDSWLNRNVYYLRLTGNPIKDEEKNRLYHVFQGDFRMSFESTKSYTPNQDRNVVANIGSSSSSSSSTRRRGPPPGLSKCSGSSNS